MAQKIVYMSLPLVFCLSSQALSSDFVQSNGLTDIESLVRTGLVAAARSSLPQTVQRISGMLSRLSAENAANGFPLTTDDRLRVFRVNLTLLQCIAAERDCRDKPYDSLADLNKLYKTLSKEAIYYDAKQTAPDEIPDIDVRKETLRFREERKKLIERSQNDRLLDHIFERKIEEVKRTLREAQRNEPLRKAGFESVLKAFVADGKTGSFLSARIGMPSMENERETQREQQ